MNSSTSSASLTATTTSWDKNRDGNLAKAFAKYNSSIDACTVNGGSNDAQDRQARTILNKCIEELTSPARGVVLYTQGCALALEYFDSVKTIHNQRPAVLVQYVSVNNLQDAQKVLNGPNIDKVSHRVLSTTPEIFDRLRSFLVIHSRSLDIKDLVSNQYLREGLLFPLPHEPTLSPPPDIAGWRALLGCSHSALSLFRIFLGSLLVLELMLRFRFLRAFYTDQGTLPTHLLKKRVDTVYQLVCLHCHFASLQEQQILLSIQVALATFFTLGYYARLTAVLSWYLYLSLTLRNTWMNYILDRYFHYLLFLSMFLPLDQCWGLKSNRRSDSSPTWTISVATIALKCLVVWIYVDAGYGKLSDPLGGWSYHADPLPALDTYARHTVAAQYLYALLGPPGLRVLTPLVVWVELLAAPTALLGSFVGSSFLIYLAVILISSLHVGIALTLRNSALLSFVACVPWAAFLPFGWRDKTAKIRVSGRFSTLLSIGCIGAMVAGCMWLETISQACDQSVKHIWSTLLHNRWNVFVGAEEYVTWEIAPGQLRDGSIVDVWGRRDEVLWDLPGGGAPSTSTARPGRWRSFPYLAELEGEEGDALWNYLCWEWDHENDVRTNFGRQLIKYNFFMLQADVLPNMTFSATRKRLIQSVECVVSGTREKIGDDLRRVNDEL